MKPDCADQIIPARVVRGHRVASGLGGDDRFPGGTILLQTPHFLARGFDIRNLYPGTVNVSIAPLGYRVVKARHTFTKVKWHSNVQAEDFSFFDVRVLRPGEPDVEGFIYYPHPDTKPEHFQPPDVLELLLPFTEGLGYGAALSMAIPKGQMVVESPIVSK